MLNGIEAMRRWDRPRELVIGTERDEANRVRIAVGTPDRSRPREHQPSLRRVYTPTWWQGIGALDQPLHHRNHGGRLWAESNEGMERIFFRCDVPTMTLLPEPSPIVFVVDDDEVGCARRC